MTGKQKKESYKMLGIAAGLTVCLLVLLWVFGKVFPAGQKEPNNHSHTVTATGTTTTTQIPTQTEPSSATANPRPFPEMDPVTGGELLEIHFLNVGEADAIFLTAGGENMLIDAGENNMGKAVVRYLQSLGVNTLDYLIATHPDQDHIGGMDTVVKRMTIRNFYMSSQAKDSKHYESLMEEVAEKALEITIPIPGVEHDLFTLGQAKVQILAPLTTYEKDTSNNSSLVLRITFGTRVFLLMGDAMEAVEEDILAAYGNLKADVLKVGHHGRADATSDQFANSVSPEYAIISCEAGNASKAVINKLEQTGAEVFVLGESGTIVLVSDGTQIKVENKG